MKTGTYVAQRDLPWIKYSYRFGGGIKGRTVKCGDLITVIGFVTDIDIKSIETIELLNRVIYNGFENNFKLIG